MIDTGLREYGSGVLSRITFAVAQTRRTTAGSALVRLVTALSALAALLIAVPIDLMGVWVALALPLAAGVGLFPRTRIVSLTLSLSVLGWLVSTLGLGAPVTLWRIAGLTVALYATHSGATLGAVLPYDCTVAPAVLWRWAGRTLAVVAAGLVVGVGGLVLAVILPGASSVVGPVVGSAVAAGLAFLLAWNVRRRDPRDTSGPAPGE